jgi:hypothetical protein
MIYWVREVAGWLLTALGLLVFAGVYDFCQRHLIFEAALLLVMGVFVFRGGIHLLKVAVAARVCRQAQDRLYPAPVRPELPRRALPSPPYPGDGGRG